MHAFIDKQEAGWLISITCYAVLLFRNPSVLGGSSELHFLVFVFSCLYTFMLSMNLANSLSRGVAVCMERERNLVRGHRPRWQL